MIHPSTLAGPNWFTGSFGTNNPFQQNTSPYFRNTPFQGQQGGFGFGNSPFQGQQGGFGFGNNPFQGQLGGFGSNPFQGQQGGFGFGSNPFQGQQGGFGFGNNPFQGQLGGFGSNPAQFQNTINEIIRQTVPTGFTGLGFQPTNGFQTPTFGWNSNGFQTPTNTWTLGTQLQNTPFNNWQTQSFFTELIRQTTNQVLQSLPQLNQTGLYQGTNPQQQQFWNTCVQVCQQACYWSCQPVCQAIVTCAVEAVNQQNPNNQTNNQNIWNTCVQICQQACQQVCQTVCQSVITTAITTTNQQTTPFGFTQQNTPFNINTSAPQYSFTPGIPTGVGAF